MSRAAARAKAAALFTAAGCNSVRFFEEAAGLEFGWGAIRAVLSIELFLQTPEDVLLDWFDHIQTAGIAPVRARKTLDPVVFMCGKDEPVDA